MIDRPAGGGSDVLPTLVSRVDRVDDVVDDWWERRFRGRPVFDRLFYTASEAANFSLLWHALGLVQAIARRNPRSLIEMGVILSLESALVNGVLKSLFRRCRPEHSGPRPHSLRQPLTSSFPSGHASAAVVAASILSRKSRWPLAWYGLALVVALSRIHVRIHHVSDVVGGIGVGIALSAVTRRLLRR